MSAREIPSDAKFSASAALLPAVICFLITLFLGGWKNDFPFYYHVDEPGKARQILTEERNLHHPLLMLTTTETIVRVAGIPPNPQIITQTGRWVSATFNALAVGLLAWTVAQALGTFTGWIAGLIAATHWNIFELSHYFKEDPSLAFGIMTAIAAVAWWRRSQGLASALGLGAALALALSGKYFGVIALLLLPLVWWQYPPAKGRRISSALAILGAFAGVFSLINWGLLTQPDVLQASLEKETTGVLQGGQVATHSFFHVGFFKRFYQVARVAALPGLVFFLIFSVRKLRRLPLEMLALVILPFFLAIILGFSQKDSGRYFLPGVFGVCAVAALGWHDWLQWARLQKHVWVKALTVIAALVTIGGAADRLMDYVHGFGEGSREMLSLWIKENLPADAVIAQTETTKLSDPTLVERGSLPSMFPQKLVTIDDLPEDFTLDQLRAKGVTHLAATEPEWHLFLKGGKVREKAKDKFTKSREFWQSVQKQTKIVWECDAGKVGTHNPPMRLWELNSPK